MDRRVETPGRWWRRRRWRWALIALCVLVAAIVGYSLVPASNAVTVNADAVQTGEVTHAPFQDYAPLRAEVTPLSTTFVAAIAGGQVADVIASDGTLVSKGQPLARLSNGDLQREVATQSASIAGQLSDISQQRLSVQRNRLDTEQSVADAQNALQQAETDLRKKKILLAKNIVNQAAVDPLQDEVDFRRKRLAALTRGRSQESATLSDQASGIATTEQELRRSLTMVKDSLDALTIRAPVSGRLTDFDLQPGQTLAPGDRVAQVDAEDAWKLLADVDQYYLGQVRRGQSAQADIDGKKVALTVIKVLPKVADGRFRVELGFSGATPAGLSRGQTLDVRLTLGADRPATVAPAGAWLDAGGHIAFVLDGAGHARRRQIVTGRRNPEQVEVTSGLQPGDRIVTSSIGDYQQFSHLIIR